jgi:hypothetical protein
MTEDNELVPIPGSEMAMPAELAQAFADLEADQEELGGSMMDMLNVYKLQQGRWVTGEEKKDEVWGIVLHDFPTLRSYWPDTGDDSVTNDPPTCWSLGGPEKDATPHPDCAEAQAEKCIECPFNEFGTKGKGKACKTKRATFIMELDPEKLEALPNGRYALTEESLLRLALIRMSATAKSTRRSATKWAEDLRGQCGGKLVRQGVVTRWSLVDEPGPRGDYSAPVLACMGGWDAPKDCMEQIVDISTMYRDGEAEATLLILSGRPDEE